MFSTNGKLLVDVSKLKILSGNRPIHYPHVIALKKSIADNNRIGDNPIKINQKMEIIDGQHRYTAAKELGISEIPCLIVDGGIEYAQTMSANTKAWNVYDYAYSYAALGNPNYIKFIEFMKKYRLKSHEVIILLAGSTSSFETFRRGDFIVKTERDAEKIATWLEDFKDHLPSYKDRSFVLAFTNVARHKEYIHNRMLHKLEILRIRKCADRSMYIDELTRIYNYKMGKQSKVDFKQG